MGKFVYILCFIEIAVFPVIPHKKYHLNTYPGVCQYLRDNYIFSFCISICNKKGANVELVWSAKILKNGRF